MPPPGQEQVANFYNSKSVQIGVAVLIGANFFTNIVEKELDPHGKKYTDIFSGFELFYNIFFTIELGINMWAHWFKPFISSGWNIFDIVVVSIGIINTLKVPLPPACAMLRMMRAFKVMKLFNRIHSLNKIIVAIVHAIPGVANAFLILGIVMSIYSILAVEFYYEVGSDCLDDKKEYLKPYQTARGYCAGGEYWGTFSKAIYTFFQVLTGESWSEAVARPAIWFYHDDAIRAVGSGLFFVSYVLITAFVLTNVVVAVLLDKMVDPEVAQVADAAHPDSEAEATDASEEASNTPDPTPEDLKSSVALVNSQVDEMMQDSKRMAAEFEPLKNDLIYMQEQMASIIQCLPGK